RGLATALAVLAEEGVAGLTTRNVARRAEASVPAVYEVFGDKAGLIGEVFFEGFRMLGDALAALPPTDDPLEALERIVGRWERRKRISQHPEAFEEHLTDEAGLVAEHLIDSWH